MAGLEPSSPKSLTDPWTTRMLLRWMAEHFESRAIDSPRLAAELLLARVLGCERLRLYMEADRPASADERARLRDLVARAARHEPVQYLLGEAWFFGQPFEVGPAVLIPRPSTETLVEHVLHWLKSREDLALPRVADVGTGSGCIAVSIALNCPRATVLATDVNDEALAVAQRNAARHGVGDRIHLAGGSLLQPLESAGGVFDVIASNPPYIPDHEWGSVAPNVKDFEPHAALRGGADGLDFIRPLIAGAASMLAPGGLLAIEIAACQRDAVIDLAARHGAYEGVQVLKDHEGLDRVLTAARRA